VAYGATVQAAILTKAKGGMLDQMLLLDVTPLSVGIEAAGGRMSVIIPRNTQIPVKKERKYSTNDDNPTEVLVKVYEGERQQTKDCNMLGKFVLKGIPKQPAGVPIIEVVFEMDSNGILNVEATEKGTQFKQNISISKEDTGRLNADEIEEMLKDAEKHKEADDAMRRKHEALQRLEDYIFGIRNGLVVGKQQGMIPPKHEEKVPEVEEEINACLQWIEENPDCHEVAYDVKRKEMGKAIGKNIGLLFPNGLPGQDADWLRQILHGVRGTGQLLGYYGDDNKRLRWDDYKRMIEDGEPKREEKKLKLGTYDFI